MIEKFALIDIGSNKIRMSVIRIKENSFYDIYEVFTQPTNLGKDILDDNLIKQATITELISIVKMFESTAISNGVNKVVVSIYGFIEQAKNFVSFNDHFFSSTGYVLHVIRDNDEANAIFTAVVSSIDQTKGLICCLTDTNAYLINYTKRAIIEYKKFSLASAYQEGESKENVYNKIKSEVENIDFLKDNDTEVPVVAVGPAFRTLGMLARKVLKYPVDIENMYSMDMTDFKAVYECINNISADKIVKIKGMSENSSKYLAADLNIIHAILDGIKAQGVIISSNGIRDGLVENLIVRPLTEKPVFDVLVNSIDNIRAFYDLNIEQSDSVYRYAILLFKQLKVVHKLHRGYVKPLRVAASFYNCGNLINLKNSCKYAFDIIINSNIYGLTQREVLLSAFICMCQNQDNFSLSEWMKYQSLFIDSDLDAVKKLGTIVRLAAALSKFKSKKIKDIECDILGDSVILKTIADESVKFEILEGKKVCGDFKKVFKKTLEII